MIPNRCAGQRLECAEEEEGDAVAAATDDDKAVRPLDKQILEVFGCRSNNMSIRIIGTDDSIAIKRSLPVKPPCDARMSKIILQML